ncbi:hypothetical protein SKAU_G00061740 [Synaphobranchus kaupii]|uniref:Uncharacterized protein n=1 Tax=Synaphobranchus kaupii TaxID=118154 RepID=A0A9Q1G673_SYNKA|nr:hypothetical protein SKAU_G00061740 [Synaphobranchus kaupii]
MTPVFYVNGPERRGGLMRRLGCGKTTGLCILGLISILGMLSILLTSDNHKGAQNESDTTQEDPEDPSQNPQFSTPAVLPGNPYATPTPTRTGVRECIKTFTSYFLWLCSVATRTHRALAI